MEKLIFAFAYLLLVIHCQAATIKVDDNVVENSKFSNPRSFGDNIPSILTSYVKTLPISWRTKK